MCTPPAEPLDPAAYILLDAVEEWVRDQRVADIVPERKLRSLLAAVRSDVAFWERQHHQYNRLWHQIETQLRQDRRPLREVLGAEVTADALLMLEQYDSVPLIRSVMRSSAIERLLGSVLYEALFAFIKSVDILGQLMSSLPFFGPMRDQIVASSKKQIDLVLGDQISTFLGSYTKEAVKSAIAYVDSNSADFARAQRKIAEDFLSRPFNEVLPSEADAALFKDMLWLRVRELRAPNEDELIANLYAEFGDETVDTLLPIAHPRVEQVNRPRIFVKGRDLLARNLHSFITSERGRTCLAQLQTLEPGAPAPPATAAVPTGPAAAHQPLAPADGRSAIPGGTDSSAADPAASAADDWD
jgi:hypothetical protein